MKTEMIKKKIEFLKKDIGKLLDEIVEWLIILRL